MAFESATPTLDSPFLSVENLERKQEVINGTTHPSIGDLSRVESDLIQEDGRCSRSKANVAASAALFLCGAWRDSKYFKTELLELGVWNTVKENEDFTLLQSGAENTYTPSRFQRAIAAALTNQDLALGNLFTLHWLVIASLISGIGALLAQNMTVSTKREATKLFALITAKWYLYDQHVGSMPAPDEKSLTD